MIENAPNENAEPNVGSNVGSTVVNENKPVMRKHECKVIEESKNFSSSSSIESESEKVQVLRSKTFPDGTVLEQLANGCKRQTTTEGVILVQYLDGRQIQTFTKTGMQIEVSPSGDFTQRYRNGSSVQVHNGILTTTSHTGKINETRVSSQLFQISDGTKVQFNDGKDWAVIVEYPNEGTTIQKSFDGTKWIYATQNKRILFHDGIETRFDIKTKEKSQGEANIEFLKKIQARAKLAEQQCKSLQRGNKEVEQKLRMKLEQTQKAMVRATKESMIKNKALVEANTSLNKQVEELREQVGKKKPEMKTSETQWNLLDAQTQFFKRQFTQDLSKNNEDTFQDPQLSRAIVMELQQKVIELEEEKQNIEDKLIDLRFSLQNGTKSKKSRGLFSRLIPMLIFSPRKEKESSDADTSLQRTESLMLATIESIKRRQEEAQEELSKKKRESISLESDKVNLARSLEQVQQDRDNALQRCKELEAKVNELLLISENTVSSSSSSPSSRSFSPDFQMNPDDRCCSVSSNCSSMGILPAIDEELFQMRLGAVSPMI